VKIYKSGSSRMIYEGWRTSTPLIEDNDPPTDVSNLSKGNIAAYSPLEEIRSRGIALKLSKEDTVGRWKRGYII
jgi:hypothetical protein